MKKTLVYPLALLAAVAAVYGHGLSGGFVWDDEALILQKRDFYGDPGNIGAVITTPDTAHAERSTPYYRPLTALTYMADRHLWGDRPFGYRLENLLLHGAVVVLLYLLFFRVFGDPIPAFFGALIFAVHPANVEAVDFISARNNLLCAALLAGSLLLLGSGTAGGVPASLAAYALALLSKEPAVVVPFFLMSLNLLTDEKRLRTGKGILAAFFVVTALYFILRFTILGALTSEAGAVLSTKQLCRIASALFEDFRILLFPWKLNAFYTWNAIPFRTYKALGALAGMGALLYGCMRRGSSEPVRTGCLWVLWGLLLISNAIPIPSAPVAERYLYVPLMGFALISGHGAYLIYRRRAWWGVAAVAGICLLLGARAFERGFVWKDNPSLFLSMIAADPGNAEAHYDLGYIYLDAGRKDLALREWSETVRLDPAHAGAHNGLGILSALTGNYRAALFYYEKTLALSPKEFTVHFNVAKAADLLGDSELAIRHYRAFLDKASGSPPVPDQGEKVSEARQRLSVLLEGESRR